MDYKNRKAIQVSPDVMKRFKLYCVKEGFKMGIMVDKAITEWLDRQEK